MDAYIKEIAYYLPNKILTNDEIAQKYPNWSSKKVFDKVGIIQRHVADVNETAADLAERAANVLFSKGAAKEEIDFLLFCTQSPDYKLPTSACILQNKLGLNKSVGALDFNLGCSGYIYGLSLAASLVISGMATNVLLLTGETYSKYIRNEDVGNRTIFGDGASATLISTSGFARIGKFVFGTDGSGFDNLILQNGGAKYKSSTAPKVNNIQYPDYLYMNGSEIFSFTLDKVPDLVKNVLTKNEESIDSINLFIFHQANKFILEFLKQKLKISDNNFLIDIEKTGNTVSSTIPIAFCNALDLNNISNNDKLLLAGFGVGLSLAGVVVYFE